MAKSYCGGDVHYMYVDGMIDSVKDAVIAAAETNTEAKQQHLSGTMQLSASQNTNFFFFARSLASVCFTEFLELCIRNRG